MPNVPVELAGRCVFEWGIIGDKLSGDVGEKVSPSTRVCRPDIVIYACLVVLELLR